MCQLSVVVVLLFLTKRKKRIICADFDSWMKRGLHAVRNRHRNPTAQRDFAGQRILTPTPPRNLMLSHHQQNNEHVSSNNPSYRSSIPNTVESFAEISCRTCFSGLNLHPTSENKLRGVLTPSSLISSFTQISVG
jgi:hypothetical protein